MIDGDGFVAVVMRAHGGPEVLRAERRPATDLRAGEVRVRVLAAAVNHSDLEIRQGNWPIRRQPPFPYVPGLEAVGEVVEVHEGRGRGAGAGDGTAAAGGSGPAWAPGDRVWTMMQGLGGERGERDGGYAEQVVVAGNVLAPLPAALDAVDAASIGLAGVTAAEGLRRLLPGAAAGDPGPVPILEALAGRRIAVTGAAGGVGSLAVALAAAVGAEVTAVVRTAEQADYVRGLGAHHVSDGSSLGILDGVLDTVAGALFAPSVRALAPHGRYCLIGAVGGSAVCFDAWSLQARVLTAWSSESLDGPSLREATAEIVARTLPLPARTVLPLADAAKAHALLEAHQVSGRIVLVP